MTPVFIDVETEVSKDLTLKRQTVLQYLAKAKILCIACAVGDEAPTVFNDPMHNMELIEYLRELMDSDLYVFVSHNWAFDGRCLEKLTGKYPQHARCSLEAAMCAWPNMPGGYALKNLGEVLRLPSGVKTGKATEVMHMTPAELDEYVTQDVRLCRDVYNLCLDRVHPTEWQIGELCNRVRECRLEVVAEAVDAAVEQFTKLADQSAADVLAILEDEDATAFGSDEAGHIKSVKPHVIKDLLLERIGFQTRTISIKKADPVALAGSPAAAVVIEKAGKANRALSHKRRVATFAAQNETTMELGWFRAHTGRFSSPSSGRGLNLHNLPKHDPVVAPTIRKMFRLPAGMCFVRADEANVEYRVSGLLSGSIHVYNLFGRDAMADPYSAFGQACTGRPIDRRTPEGKAARQFFKMAVLGLGYGMGLELWTKEILKALARPKPDFTLDNLRQTAEENHWGWPPGGQAKRVMLKTGCDPAVVVAAFHTRRLFHEIHPEFFQLATWLKTVCEEVSRGAGQAVVDGMYDQPGAPARELVDVRVSDRFEGYSVEVRCGYWPCRTVVWRDLGVRDVPQRGVCLSVMSGAKGYRALSPSVCIENLVQSAARNATCEAKLLLADAYPYLPSVHDEIMPIVTADPATVIRCRDDLVRVLGPDGTVARTGWGWSVIINPAEINVSRSLYEVPVEKLDPRFTTNAAWWDALASHPELLESLP